MTENSTQRKLTKTYVDSIPLMEKGQAFYRDPELRGFALRVGTNSKTYIAESKVNGKAVRVTIGKHGVFTPEQARIEARQILGTMARGINPTDEKRDRRARAVSLQHVLDDFLQTRNALKPRTVSDYRYVMGRYLSDWLNKPITDITKDMIEKRHIAIATGLKVITTDKNGERKEVVFQSESQANLTMRYLRALFNYAAVKYEDRKGNSVMPDNPVKRLSQTRAWYRIARRQTVIKPHELEPWCKVVMAIQNDHTSKGREIFRDYLLLILFTGLRRQEAAQLTWANVDLKARTLTVPDTKNHQDHTLPLTGYLHDLLWRRRVETMSEYVFPSDHGKGYITIPHKQIVRIIKESGITFSIHDLRRTFITVAESLDISAYALKRLVNHKMNNDVTAGYIISDVERLREPMQRITDYLLKCSGQMPSATIIDLTGYGKAVQ